MDELSPRARALLEAAHGTDDPIPGDSARVRRNVMTRIGTTGLGAAVLSLSLERAKALIGVATPKVVAMVLIAVGGSAVYQRAHQRELPSIAAPSAIVKASLVASPAPVAIAAAVPDAQPPSAAALTPAIPQHPHRAPLKHRAQASDPSASLDAEMRCVRAADAALRGGNVNQAESLLEQHAREFPLGTLSEERDGLRIVAGCQNGDSGATRAATAFLERSPRSLLAGRVRAACSTRRSGD